MMGHVSMLVKIANEINGGRREGRRDELEERKGGKSRGEGVDTDTLTLSFPGDWDQILDLSKATLHQRHSNEEVFYHKLSSKSVCLFVCVCTRMYSRV